MTTDEALKYFLLILALSALGCIIGAWVCDKLAEDAN